MELAEDKETRNRLIEQNRGLVFYIASQYGHSVDESDELAGAGMLGLIKAADTFRPEKKLKFATYAVPCIRNEILMLLRRNKKHKRDISMNSIVGADEDGNELHLSDILGTEPGVVARRSEEEADREMLLSAINSLPERERILIVLLYGLDRQGCDGRTQMEVGRRLGISGSYVSRIRKHALQHLRREYMRLAE